MSMYRDAFDRLGCVLAELNNEDCKGCHCIYSDCGEDRYKCKGVSDLKILGDAICIAEKSSRLENFLVDLVNTRKGYKKLKRKGMTKRDLCDLVVPFKDAYGLEDTEALGLIRDNVSIEEFLGMYMKIKSKVG